LKQPKQVQAPQQPGVAPCVGAWIETRSDRHNGSPEIVAPCVGAWIETVIANKRQGNVIGRALRGRVD